MDRYLSAEVLVQASAVTRTLLKVLVFSFDLGAVPKWLRERSAKPSFSGSNPLGASKHLH